MKKIELLKALPYKNSSEYVKIAKGKNEYPSNFLKAIIKLIKLKWLKM